VKRDFDLSLRNIDQVQTVGCQQKLEYGRSAYHHDHAIPHFIGKGSDHLVTIHARLTTANDADVDIAQCFGFIRIRQFIGGKDDYSATTIAQFFWKFEIKMASDNDHIWTSFFEACVESPLP